MQLYTSSVTSLLRSPACEPCNRSLITAAVADRPPFSFAGYPVYGVRVRGESPVSPRPLLFQLRIPSTRRSRKQKIRQCPSHSVYQGNRTPNELLSLPRYTIFGTS